MPLTPRLEKPHPTPWGRISMGFPLRALFLVAVLVAAGVSGLPSATWAAQQIAVDPTSYDFGDLLVGETSTAATFSVTNEGDATLTISELLVGVGFAIQSEDCVGTLGVGAGCTVEVQFLPFSGGTYSETLQITSDDPSNGVLTVDLSGTGVKPDISVSPLSINFGNVGVGSTSAPGTVTVQNGGNAGLEMGTMSLTGSGSGHFSISSDTCSGGTVAVSGQCTLQVVMEPGSTGTKTATLPILSSDQETPVVNVGLSGVGVVSNIAVSPVSIDFGDVEVGAASLPATVTVDNLGAGGLAMGTLALSGADAGQFAIDTDTCSGETVPASGQCTVTLSMAPSTAGPKAATLPVLSNDPETPEVGVALVGTGTTASGANANPSAPQLLFPANGATGVATTVEFRWQAATDADSDPLTYAFVLCGNDDFSGCSGEPVNALFSLHRGPAGWGGLTAGFLVLGFLWPRAGGRRGAALLIAGALALGTLGLPGCAEEDPGPGGEVPPPGITHTESGLAPNTTYFWKVVVDDGQGGSTESAVFSFTTE